MYELTNYIKPLETWLRGIVSDEVKKAMTEEREASVPERQYSRAELCTLLHISEPTLWNYCKQGKITPIRVGRRVLFAQSEVERLIGKKKLRI